MPRATEYVEQHSRNGAIEEAQTWAEAVKTALNRPETRRKLDKNGRETPNPG
jgi:hypothetical protein